MITIKELTNDKCSSCNAGGRLLEVSVSRSNTIQGSTLYYRLCRDCVKEMIETISNVDL